MARPPLKITSADNQRLKSAVRLRERKERNATGRFIAEGGREVGRAIQAGLEPFEFYVAPGLTGQTVEASLAQLGADESMTRQCQVYELSDHLMPKLAYHERPEGVIAVFKTPTYSFESLAARADAQPGRPALYLIAVGIEKPGNLGALARTCAGAGADGLIVADGVVDAFNPNAIRASTGAVFSLPVVGADRAQVCAWLGKRNVALLVSTPADAVPYTQADMRRPVALAIGAEDQGLDDAWLAAGQRVRVPMAQGPVDSLNASVAGALLLYEAVRQRGL